MQTSYEVFQDRSALLEGIERAAGQGYAFVPNAISETMLGELEAEARGLDFELGDHVTAPINEGSKQQVTQMHERAYLPIGHHSIPFATLVTDALALQASRLYARHFELGGWRATEAGYQLYRDPNHHISKHRDRRSDELLAATITIRGAARIGIHEAVDDPDDYANTRPIEVFRAAAGTIMFLRAKGLGNGERVIHDVSPPEEAPRLILNLRMRPDILPAPAETA